MKVDLKNRIALVTGASRGIGCSISLALARCGAHVVLSARTLSALQEVEKEIREGGGKVTAIPVDTSKAEDVIALFKKIQQIFGKLDITVNNAGSGYFTDLVDFPIDKFDQIIQVNLRGTFLCCQESMKIMIPAR